jgi:hypothetical protein
VEERETLSKIRINHIPSENMGALFSWKLIITTPPQFPGINSFQEERISEDVDTPSP